MTKNRVFTFSGRPSRSAAVSAIRAALEDEGFQLSLGASERLGWVIRQTGELRVTVPGTAIVEKETA